MNQKELGKFMIESATRIFGPSECYPIKFQGRAYLLIGSKTDGAIATRHQYANFKDSYAHLFPDGIVRRYGKEIGRAEDIVFTRKRDREASD
jgi:hypothetical protein